MALTERTIIDKYEIQGYEGLYSITSDGRVWSHRCQKWMSAGDNGKGYKFVHLYLNQSSSRFYVHRLVASAFLDNPDSLPQVNHIDGVKDNNRVSNLEWSSLRHNMRHAWDEGLCRVWEKQVESVTAYNKTKRSLSDEQVRDIRKQHGRGDSARSLARKHGVQSGTVSQIVNGQSYKDVA